MHSKLFAFKSVCIQNCLLSKFVAFKIVCFQNSLHSKSFALKIFCIQNFFRSKLFAFKIFACKYFCIQNYWHSQIFAFKRFALNFLMHWKWDASKIFLLSNNLHWNNFAFKKFCIENVCGEILAFKLLHSKNLHWDHSEPPVALKPFFLVFSAIDLTHTNWCSFLHLHVTRTIHKFVALLRPHLRTPTGKLANRQRYPVHRSAVTRRRDPTFIGDPNWKPGRRASTREGLPSLDKRGTNNIAKTKAVLQGRQLAQRWKSVHVLAKQSPSLALLETFLGEACGAQTTTADTDRQTQQSYSVHRSAVTRQRAPTFIGNPNWKPSRLVA